jgi:spore maturation protein CgeB/tetratricopeptide (TPR) repeat protein
MKILTFNWHEAYICSLTRTGHDFEIVERFKGGSQIWFYQTRPVPENAIIVKEADALKRLASNYYDWAVCHNLKDLNDVKDFPVSKILIFHNMLKTELALNGDRYKKDEYLESVRTLIHHIEDLQLVFISKTKLNDWGLNGKVITPGIDLYEYNGYHGSYPKVLRVGNFMKRRDIMMGYSLQKKILKHMVREGDQSENNNPASEIPSTLLGINEPSDRGRFTESWDDLKECFRSHRVYLNTTVDGFEDGYNLSMLEAMATGMPVVSIANRTSPIVDNYNGYISNDIEYLSERIDYLLRFADEAKRLGEKARETIEKDFNIKDFVRNWNKVFEGARGQKKVPNCELRVTGLKTRNSKLETQNSKNILLAYVSYPVTTARYMERSLRKSHNVITCGPSIGTETIKIWNLENMKEEIIPHDISCEGNVSMEDIIGSNEYMAKSNEVFLPQNSKLNTQYVLPELFLWIESVYGYFPGGIQKLPFPTACYMIDSHINLSWHLQWSKQFDFVFVAQRRYIPDFKNAGCKNVYWLPLGCDPDIHKKFEVDKIHDIGFVGSVTKNHIRRKGLLDKLSRHFNVHAERSFLEDMALTFSRSKIIFNEAFNGDLNMRVFESLSTGSMLLTDSANGSGLTDFFKDREHLVIYDEDSIVELAGYYLHHDEEREEIAKKGREGVLKGHTYDNRVNQMMNDIFKQESGVRRLQRAQLSRQESGVIQNAQNLTQDSEIEDPLLLAALKQIEDNNYVDALRNLTFALHGRELTSLERFILYISLGECCIKLGKIDEGRGFYEKSKEIDPQSEKPYIGIGDTYVQESRYSEAVKEFKSAVRLNPGSDRAFYGLGISLGNLDMVKEGYEMLRLSLDINIDNIHALNLHLKYSYELNSLDSAREYLLRYLELHPASLDILFFLSRLYFKMERYEDAKDTIEKILLFNSGHHNALELMNIIDTRLKG